MEMDPAVEYLPGTGGIADALPPVSNLISIISAVNGGAGPTFSDVALIKRDQLKHLLFNKVYQLASEDLPGRLQHTDIKYSTDSEKTLYLQVSVPTPDRASSFINSIYTYGLNPRVLGMFMARTWMKRKWKTYHGSKTPLLWLLRKGYNHFIKTHNSTAASFFTDCISNYWTILPDIDNLPPLPAAKQKDEEYYEAILKYYFASKVKMPYVIGAFTAHEQAFYDELQTASVTGDGGVRIEYVNFEFTGAIELVNLYRMTNLTSDHVRDIRKYLVDKPQRLRQVLPDPTNKTRYSCIITGRPLLSDLLHTVVHIQGEINEFHDNSPEDYFCSSRQLRFLLLSINQMEQFSQKNRSNRLEYTILSPIFHNSEVDSLGYALTGAWLNVRSILEHQQPTDPLTRLLDESRVITPTAIRAGIQKAVQLQPISLLLAGKYIVNYVSCRQFLNQYRHWKDKNTLYLETLWISLRAEQVRIEKELKQIQGQYPAISNAQFHQLTIPIVNTYTMWFRAKLERYRQEWYQNPFHRQADMLNLLSIMQGEEPKEDKIKREMYKNLNGIFSLLDISNLDLWLDPGNDQILKKNINSATDRVLQFYWKKLQELAVDVLTLESTHPPLAKAQKISDKKAWIAATLEQFQKDPALVRQITSIEFNILTTTEFMRRYIPKNIISPAEFSQLDSTFAAGILKLRSKKLTFPDDQGITLLRNYIAGYTSLEQRAIAIMLQRVQTDPAPVFIAK